MIITIDGPTASGKSTLAVNVARTLHIQYIATGLLFRAIGWLLTTQCGYELDSLNAVDSDDFSRCIDPKKLKYSYSTQLGAQIFWDAKDITSYLKNPTMDTAASILGINLLVRDWLLAYIRHIAGNKDTVAEGRDMGTVVFPDATFKLYVVASLTERAHRWRTMQKKLGHIFTQKEAETMVSERDRRDSSRTIAPLRQAEDAVLIDSTTFSPDQTLEQALEIINKR